MQPPTPGTGMDPPESVMGFRMEGATGSAAYRPRRLGPGSVAAAALVLGLLALLGLGVLRRQSGPIAVGSVSPDFVLTTFEGETIRAQDLRGRAVLINFWASWCLPCEQEAEALERSWQASRDEGVVFLGVNYVDTEPEARDYLDRFGITYPNGPDLGTRMAQQFRILGVPETFFLDAGGVVTFVQIGPFASDEEIQTALQTALAP
ncbi:MAG: TlpA disulfide reductase family protein [Anaerolineales bacterium]